MRLNNPPDESDMDRDMEIEKIKKEVAKLKAYIENSREKIKKMDKELSTSVFNFNVKYAQQIIYYTPRLPIHWVAYYTEEKKEEKKVGR